MEQVQDELSNGRNAYVVTKGSYSDYHICAVYSDEGLAQSHADEIRGQVEVYPVNTSLPIPPGKHIFTVLLRRVWKAWRGEDLEDAIEGKSHNYQFSDGPYFMTTCFARDEEHALKIGSERRAFMIANELGDHNFGQ